MEHKNLKLPPQDLEAETSVLGALMLDKDAILKIADMLAPNDFYSSGNQKIYKAALELFEKGQPIDALTIQARLKEKGELEGVGGTSYLSDLIDSVPSSAHVTHYANIVREKRVRRDLLRDVSEDAAQSVFAQSALLARGWLDPNPTRSDEVFKAMIESVVSGRLPLGDAIGNGANSLEALLRQP